MTRGQTIWCLGNTSLSLKNWSFNNASHQDVLAICTINTAGQVTIWGVKQELVSSGLTHFNTIKQPGRKKDP